MSAFRVGEIAIAHGFQFSTEYNGLECEIIGELRESGLCFCSKTGALLPSSLCYFVQWPDGTAAEVEPKNLRKRRPPSTDESESRQAMLDCIERARRPVEVPA